MGNRDSRRVLLVSGDGTGKPKTERRAPNVVANFSDARRELESRRYDAVFLRVECSRDLSYIVPLKAAAPRTPLIAVLRKPDAAMDLLARDCGADRVLTDASHDPRFPQADRTQFLLDRMEELQQAHRILQAKSRRICAAHFDAAQPSLRAFAPLVVEDDPMEALLLRQCFQQAGLPLPIPVSASAEDAMRVLSGTAVPRPTLVITDLHLRGASGHELLRWIRGHPLWSSMVVFVLSSSPLRTDMHEALSKGADQYFVKPLRNADFLEMAKVMALRWSLLREAQRSANPVAPASCRQ